MNSRLSDIFRLAPIIGKIRTISSLEAFTPPPSVSCFHWPTVSVEIRSKLRAVHASHPKVFCVSSIYPPSSSPLSASLSAPSRPSNTLHAGWKWPCMGSYSSESHQTVEKRFQVQRERALSVVVESFLLLAVWIHLLIRVSNVGEHDRHFFFPPHVLCVGASVTQASRWRCYSLLHSHSVALWSHGGVLSLVLGSFSPWMWRKSCSGLHFHYYTAGDEHCVKWTRRALPPHLWRTMLIFWPPLTRINLSFLFSLLFISHNRLICLWTAASMTVWWDHNVGGEINNILDSSGIDFNTGLLPVKKHGFSVKPVLSSCDSVEQE